MSAVRISTSQMYRTALTGMLEQQKAVGRTQEQITTNKRVLTPGDDPIAATQILQLNQEMAQTDQFNQSLGTLENRLKREEVALSGINDLILKAQELVTQTGNAALNAEQRRYIADELQSVVDSMAQQMNTTDAGGEFIFAGFQGKTQPFVKGPGGIWTYQGDEGQRHIKIAPTTSVATNDSGKAAFLDIPSVVTGVTSKSSAGNTANPPALIHPATVTDREAFDSFYPESVIIEFNPVGNVAPPGLNYTVKQVSDGRILAENQPYESGVDIQFGGVSVRITGEPAVGDSFVVESTNRTGLLEGLENYIKTLRSTGDSTSDNEKLSAELGNTLGNLGNAQTRLLETRSSVGARLNVVDAGKANNEDFKLVVKNALSEVADLDYAAAISQLTQETFILEAAQASFARVSRLSLFNFL